MGAGLRLGERRRNGNGHVGDGSADRIDLFLTRLEALERKVDSLPHASEVPGPATEPPRNGSNGHGNLEAEIAAQIAAMEQRLRRELSWCNEDGLGSVSKGLERRIEERMAPLEAEIATQHASVEELREYSLRTERSLQKLLEGVDRLVAAQGERGEGRG